LSMSLPDFEAMIRKEFEANAELIKAAGAASCGAGGCRRAG